MSSTSVASYGPEHGGPVLDVTGTVSHHRGDAGEVIRVGEDRIALEGEEQAPLGVGEFRFHGGPHLAPDSQRVVRWLREVMEGSMCLSPNVPFMLVSSVRMCCPLLGSGVYHFQGSGGIWL